MKSLVPTSDFVGLEGKTHLYTAAEGPLPKAAADAIAQYVLHKSEAEEGRRLHDQVTDACRTAAAKLMVARADDISFLGSASDAINAVAGILRFSPGDNVVVNDLEFMSVALPWMRLRSEGLDVRVVRHQNWELPASSILAAVDERTALVALSHVSFVNGWRSDVDCISERLKPMGAKLLLDVTQSAGIFPIDAGQADFVVSSTYKWLLGTHGLGILHVRPGQEGMVEPASIGWYSVSSNSTPDRYERYTLRTDGGKFEVGYLNFPAIYALNASLGYLGQLAGVDVVDHVHALGDEIIDGLVRIGLAVTTPRDRANRGASVTFVHPEAATLGERLASGGIHVWAGDGRVRASPNIFTSSSDIDMYLNALAECLPA